MFVQLEGKYVRAYVLSCVPKFPTFTEPQNNSVNMPIVRKRKAPDDATTPKTPESTTPETPQTETRHNVMTSMTSYKVRFFVICSAPAKYNQLVGIHHTTFDRFAQRLPPGLLWQFFDRKEQAEALFSQNTDVSLNGRVFWYAPPYPEIERLRNMNMSD